MSLLSGEEVSESTHRSIIHMGLNRSASQWVKSVLRRVTASVNMVHVRWNEMAFHSDYPYLDQLTEVEEYAHIFRPKGYLYSAFGGYPVGIPNIEKYRVILVVRDPRDVLVSRYYSKAISHSPPPKGSDKRDKFMRDRDRAQSMTIDQFVIEKSKKLRHTLDQYINGLLNDHPQVHIARYEEMTADVEQWLVDLLTYADLSPPEELIQEIIQEAEAVKAKKENPSDHVRKGRPGDYREKLNPDTVEKLDDTFSRALNRFGYVP